MRRELPKNDDDRLLLYLESTAWFGWSEELLVIMRAQYWEFVAWRKAR